MNQSSRNKSLILFAIAVIFLIFLTTNLDAWLIADDEGTDLYEAWRLQEGETPGEDFVAEQQPLFLHLGVILLDTFGHTVKVLRAASTTMVVAGAFLLALAMSRIMGFWVAATSMALILTSGLVVEQARLFRPDPMMFGCGMVALGATLLATHLQNRRWWLFAGALYGLSFLFKPFAVVVTGKSSKKF